MNRKAVTVLVALIAVLAAVFIGVALRRGSEDQVGVGHMEPEDLRRGPVSTEGQRRQGDTPPT